MLPLDRASLANRFSTFLLETKLTLASMLHIYSVHMPYWYIGRNSKSYLGSYLLLLMCQCFRLHGNKYTRTRQSFCNLLLIGSLIFSMFQKSSSPLTADSDHILPISSQKASSSSSSSQWSSSLAVSLVRPLSHEVSQGSSKTAEEETGINFQGAPIRAGRSSPSLSRLGSGHPLQAQVARSELNVRLPRGT